MKYSLPSIHSSLKYTFLIIGLLFVTANSNAAISWQTINNNIQFLKQQDALRFYDSNQVLIEGDECALLVDTSGNFAGVEQLVDELKKRLKTPLCYLVATHYHDDHLLGMAVIQHFYPNAKLITHQQVSADFKTYQKAYTDKLDSYEKSIELSYQRLASIPKEEQTAWREKLELAKARLFRWREYKLSPPDIALAVSKTLDLGGFELNITPHMAHTNGDLTVTTNNESILIGGDIVDWLPYPGHGELESWQTLLKQYIGNEKLSLIIPGHGGILNKQQLKQPLAFLNALTEHVKSNQNLTTESLIEAFPQKVLAPYQQDTLNKKSSQLFLQAGLNRAKSSK